MRARAIAYSLAVGAFAILSNRNSFMTGTAHGFILTKLYLFQQEKKTERHAENIDSSDDDCALVSVCEEDMHAHVSTIVDLNKYSFARTNLLPLLCL